MAINLLKNIDSVSCLQLGQHFIGKSHRFVPITSNVIFEETFSHNIKSFK